MSLFEFTEKYDFEQPKKKPPKTNNNKNKTKK